MKKTLKYLTILFAIIIVGYIAVILSSQFIFTKKINLSCKGTWTQESIHNNKLIYKGTKNGLESVIITITEYPLSKPIIYINNQLNLLTSELSTKDSLRVMHSDDEQIFGGERNYKDEWNSSFFGIKFNRLTKSIEISKFNADEKAGDKNSDEFIGQCEVVKPL